MVRPRVKFFKIIGGLAKIEGSAEVAEDALRFELAMTASPEGPMKGVLKRSLRYADLEEVRYARRFLRPSILTFISAKLEAFASIPGASGYEYAVTPLGPAAQIRAFVGEVQLAIAEANMEQFTRQIEEATGEE